METPPDVVRLVFRYGERDWMRAIRAHHASGGRLKFDLLVMLVLALAGAYFWASSRVGLGKLCVAISVFMAAVYVALLVVIPRSQFRREKKFADEYSLTFSDAGIEFQTVSIESHLQWSFYSRAMVDDYSYLIYYGGRHFTLVPRHVFTDEAQRQAFERLLVKYIPNVVRRTGN